MNRIGTGLIYLGVLFYPLIGLAEDGAFFATAGAGFLSYTEDAIEKTDLDYAADFEVSLGRYFADHYAHELVAGYLHDGHAGDDIKLYTLSLAVMRRFFPDCRVSLYAGGGFTAAFFSKYYGHIYGEERKDQDFRPGINLLSGMQVELGWNIFVRLQATYRIIKKIRLGQDTLNPSGLSVVFKFGYHF